MKFLWAAVLIFMPFAVNAQSTFGEVAVTFIEARQKMKPSFSTEHNVIPITSTLNFKAYTKGLRATSQASVSKSCEHNCNIFGKNCDTRTHIYVADMIPEIDAANRAYDRMRQSDQWNRVINEVKSDAYGSGLEELQQLVRSADPDASDAAIKRREREFIGRLDLYRGFLLDLQQKLAGMAATLGDSADVMKAQVTAIGKKQSDALTSFQISLADGTCETGIGIFESAQINAVNLGYFSITAELTGLATGAKRFGATLLSSAASIQVQADEMKSLREDAEDGFDSDFSLELLTIGIEDLIKNNPLPGVLNTKCSASPAC